VCCVSGKICARDPGAGLCDAHRVERAGDRRSYAIPARGPFAESAGASALRPRRRPNLQAEANRNFGARHGAQVGLERAGSVEVKTLKRLQALQSSKSGRCTCNKSSRRPGCFSPKPCFHSRLPWEFQNAKRRRCACARAGRQTAGMRRT
jgi:hypothetical protein